MNYAIVGFGKIGQAPRPTPSPVKNIDVIVAKPPAAPKALAAAGLGRLDPRSSPRVALREALEGRHDSSWRSRSGSIARLRRPCRAWKGQDSQSTRTNGVLGEELGRSSVLRRRREGVHRPPKLVKGFQSPGCSHPGLPNPVRRGGGHRVVFLSSDDEDANRSRLSSSLDRKTTRWPAPRRPDR